MALSFRGGIHMDEHKSARSKATQAMPAPAVVVIPMSMHIGAECKPLVAKGDTVLLGQKIGAADTPISAPVHASVSGKVLAVEPRIHPNGAKVMSVVIENDYQDTVHPSVQAHGSLAALSAEEITDLAREAGVVGLGGAVFPTAAKIRSSVGKVETLIINCAECEPYITSGHRMMLECTTEILDGVRFVMKALGLTAAIIAVESNKFDVVKAFERALPKGGNITVKVVETKYPQGGEKQLVLAVTGKEVPPGALPSAVGCVVFNPETCLSVYRAAITGMPLITRVVTVAGSAVANPKNLLCRIGTPVGELYAAAGGFRESPYKLIMGGPMMGTALTSLDAPVVKSTNALLAFSREEEHFSENPTCIRCGRCSDACPVNLMPVYINMYYEKEMLDELVKLNVADCIECGICTYVCPGRLHLAQSCRLAKQRTANLKK